MDVDVDMDLDLALGLGVAGGRCLFIAVFDLRSERRDRGPSAQTTPRRPG
jgi:hypothetical protein